MLLEIIHMFNIIVNDSFFWKTPERPPALGPSHLVPLTVCWNGVYLDISKDTKCNIESDSGSFNWP